MTQVFVYPSNPPSVAVSAVPPTVVDVTSEVGPPGPRGPAGAGAQVAVKQATALSTWTVMHDLGRTPQVQVTDLNGDVLFCDIAIDSVSPYTVTVTHNTPQTGWIYLE